MNDDPKPRIPSVLSPKTPNNIKRNNPRNVLSSSQLRLFLLHGKRHSFHPLPLLPLDASILPPKDRPEDDDHEIDPRDHQPLAPRHRVCPLACLPLLAHLEEALRVVGDDAVQTVADAPFHHLVLVDGPDVNRSLLRLGVAQELGPKVGQHEGFLEDVEGDVGDGEELSGVWDGETDVGDG